LVVTIAEKCSSSSTLPFSQSFSKRLVQFARSILRNDPGTDEESKQTHNSQVLHRGGEDTAKRQQGQGNLVQLTKAAGMKLTFPVSIVSHTYV